MDNKTTVKTELIELGFYFQDEITAIGNISYTDSEINQIIRVEISLKGYPINQPRIKLLEINGKEDLYRCIPKHWRHLDELVKSYTIESEFYICCLHNWSARSSNNGQFIYSRILSWLKSNVTEEWLKEEDLQGWRILPQNSGSTIYLSNEYIKEVEKAESKKLYKMEVNHHPFILNNSNKASSKKRGNLYPYGIINLEKFYAFFPSLSKKVEFHKLKNYILPKDFSTSTAFFVRIPRITKFKTTYQLIEYLRVNNLFNGIDTTYKNFVLFVMYKGDNNRTESAAFIMNSEAVKKNKSAVELTPLRIENIPERENAINLDVGLLGVGSLGSQVARILVEKDVSKIYLADYDRFSLENLGRHVLGSIHVGQAKSLALADFLSLLYLKEDIFVRFDDNEVAEESDILVVTVGDPQSYDRLAFDKFLNYQKPIIWAWTSPNNILQEIIITTRETGCLNCYYQKIQEDKKLMLLQSAALKEVDKQPSVEYDVCGNPHTSSMMDRLIFLATQIVSIVAYYNNNKRFKFDYVNYYWGMDDIIPTPLTGHLEKNESCFCLTDGES